MQHDLLTNMKSVTYLLSQRQGTGRIIAHCLDLDLVAVGSTLEEAEHRLNVLVRGQIANAIATGNHALLNHKAPQEYWERVKRCGELKSGALEISLPQPIPACGEIGVVKADCLAIA